MPFSSATVKVARKDIFGEPPSNNFQSKDPNILSLGGGIRVNSLGDYELVPNLKLKTPKGNGNTAIPKDSELFDFPLFSWSTRPINLNPLFQPTPTSRLPIEDTEREARSREERAKQASIEGVEVLKLPQYLLGSSSKQRCSPEYVEPLTPMPCDPLQHNLIIAKKEPSEVKKSLEVLFPRTKCCPIIPISCLKVRGDSPSEQKRKQRRKRKRPRRERAQPTFFRHGRLTATSVVKNATT